MKLNKRLSHVSLSLGVLALSLFASCDGNKKMETASTKENTGKEVAGTQIAYVNLDTLETKYTFWAEKKASFEKSQKSMEAEIDRLSTTFQNEATAFQKKAQAGTLSQTEGEAGQRKLSKMQQDIESRHEQMSGQLLKETQDFNTELQSRLDEFLARYNKDKKYAYILSESKGSGLILYADESFDITNEIIDGLNAEYKKKSTDK